MTQLLRDLRLKKGSIRRAEAATGINRGLLSKYERGVVRYPQYPYLIKLSEYLGITPTRVLELMEAGHKARERQEAIS